MVFEDSEIEKIARLAKLAVGPREMEELVPSLSAILTFFEELDCAEISGIEPMAHPLEGSQPLRSDIVSETDAREDFQSIAPAVDSGLYLVPKVIE